MNLWPGCGLRRVLKLCSVLRWGVGRFGLEFLTVRLRVTVDLGWESLGWWLGHDVPGRGGLGDHLLCLGLCLTGNL